MSYSLLSFNSISQKYKEFRKTLENRIIQNFPSLNNKECYLINNSWYKEFSNNINSYGKFKNLYSSKYNYKNFLPKNPPKFLEDIDSAIDYLKTDKFKLISKKLIYLIFKENDLKNINLVNYYSGYNKIIIEFLGEEKINALLMKNPLEPFSKNDKIFIFTIKNEKHEKKDLFEELLSLNNIKIELLKNLKNFNLISCFKIFVNKEITSYEFEQNNIEQFDSQTLLINDKKLELLQLFTFIFFLKKIYLKIKVKII